jgi:hypothetical protein
MGFSPGEFTAGHIWVRVIRLAVLAWGEPAYETNVVHWEAKDSKIVLWYPKEEGIILSLTFEQARVAYRQLGTALYSVGED